MSKIKEKFSAIKAPIGAIILWVYAAINFLALIINLIRGGSLLFMTILYLGIIIVIGVFSYLNNNKFLFFGVAALALWKLLAIIIYGFDVVSIFSFLGVSALAFILATQIFEPLASLKPIAEKFFFVPAALELLSVIILFIVMIASGYTVRILIASPFFIFLTIVLYSYVLFVIFVFLFSLSLAAAYFLITVRVLYPYDPSAASAYGAVPGTAAAPGTAGAPRTVVYTDEYAEIHCSMISHVLLYSFTFGIWYLYWVYKATKYLNRAPDSEQYVPVNKLLLCMFVPFYSIYWFYKHGERLDRLTQAKNIRADEMKSTCLVFGILFPSIACFLMQDRFNQLCQVNAQPAPAPAPYTTPAAAPAPTPYAAPASAPAPTPYAAPASAPAPVASAVSENDTVSALKQYKELLDSGVITQEEYDIKKKQLLGN